MSAVAIPRRIKPHSAASTPARLKTATWCAIASQASVVIRPPSPKARRSVACHRLQRSASTHSNHRLQLPQEPARLVLGTAQQDYSPTERRGRRLPWPYCLTHQVQDRLLPSNSRFLHPFDPRTKLFVRARSGLTRDQP